MPEGTEATQKTEHVVKVQVDGPAKPEPKPGSGGGNEPPPSYFYEDRDGQTWFVGQRPPTDGRIWLPKDRFDEAVEAERGKLTPLQARIEALKGWEEKGPQLEQRLTAAEMNSAMAVSDYPMLRDPDVQSFLRERYARHQGDAGDKAKPFADWLTAQAEAKSPLTGHLFAKPEPAQPAEAKTLKAVKDLLDTGKATVEDIVKLLTPGDAGDGTMTDEERLMGLLRDKLLGGDGARRDAKPPTDPNGGAHDQPGRTTLSLSDEQVEAYIASGEYRNNPETRRRVREYMARKHPGAFVPEKPKQNG